MRSRPRARRSSAPAAERSILPTDVADAEAVDAAAGAAEEAFGPIDIWINNAMATVFAFLWDVSAEEFRRANEVTYFGSIWGMQAALKRMRPRDRGTIVQVGSALAFRGMPLQAPYCGAKHGIQGVFESLRTELRHEHSNVHLTTVHLPGVNTPQFEHARDKLDKVSMPVAPVYQPEVAADAIHWAAHHRRREIYVGIPTVYTIWGNKVAPWLAERYLARDRRQGPASDRAQEPGPARQPLLVAAGRPGRARALRREGAHAQRPAVDDQAPSRDRCWSRRRGRRGRRGR